MPITVNPDGTPRIDIPAMQQLVDAVNSLLSIEAHPPLVVASRSPLRLSAQIPLRLRQVQIMSGTPGGPQGEWYDARLWPTDTGNPVPIWFRWPAVSPELPSLFTSRTPGALVVPCIELGQQQTIDGSTRAAYEGVHAACVARDQGSAVAINSHGEYVFSGATSVIPLIAIRLRWPLFHDPQSGDGVQIVRIAPFLGDTGFGGYIGAVPAPAAGDAAAGKFLRADGTWAVP
jgi:hypothetical protein